MQQYLNPPQEAPFMKNATFYLLDNDTTVDGLSAVEQLVCEIAAERWRSGKRVLIACEDEKQAYRLDEALWARPAESFVPHNLAGEGPRGGAPVEIAWPQKRSSSPRNRLNGRISCAISGTPNPSRESTRFAGISPSTAAPRILTNF